MEEKIKEAIKEIEKYIPETLNIYDKEILLDNITIILNEQLLQEEKGEIIRYYQRKCRNCGNIIDADVYCRCGG